MTMTCASSRLSLLLASTLLVGSAACGSSRIVDGGTGDAAADWGIPIGDFGQCDAAVDPAAASCGCVGNFRRCDTCADPCANSSVCPPVGLCPTSKPVSGLTSGCTFEASDVHACSNGIPCVIEYATESSTFPNDTMGGGCLTESFCAALPSTSPPLPYDPVCVYSDGSLFVHGPPVAGVACPSAVGGVSFCGGACGGDRGCAPPLGDWTGATEGSCLGVSDQRPFGVCAEYSFNTCNPDQAGRGFDANLCATTFGRPCVCLVLTGPGTRSGASAVSTWLPEDVCVAYRGFQPAGSVECRTLDWTLVP